MSRKAELVNQAITNSNENNELISKIQNQHGYILHHAICSKYEDDIIFHMRELRECINSQNEILKGYLENNMAMINIATEFLEIESCKCSESNKIKLKNMINDIKLGIREIKDNSLVSGIGYLNDSLKYFEDHEEFKDIIKNE